MKYSFSKEWTEKARGIASALKMNHVKPERIACIKSFGSKTRRTIARIHALGKAMQLGMQQDAFYVIELLRKFETLNEDEKEKTIIHELMHIPKSFGGGFKHHGNFVTSRNVELEFKRYQKLKLQGENTARLE